MKCSICGNEIEIKGTWTQGNNAWPVNDGRCCDKCDDTVVIPQRLMDMGYPEDFAKDMGSMLTKMRKEQQWDKRLGG